MDVNKTCPDKSNDTTKRTANLTNLSDALAGLKKSKFYEEPQPGTSNLIRSSSTVFKPVLVSPKQRGNPILKYITNVPWEYSEIKPDYVMGRTTCALFLSLRYHNLNPDYIHERLKILGQEYELRILLVQVDTSDPHHPLKYLTRVGLLANLTLMLAWSPEEAGKVIETYKIYENKPPDMIMERRENSAYQKLISALVTIRSINRTDAATLLSSFGSLDKILAASSGTLSLCPGIGPQKAARLHKVLHQPFLKDKN